MGAKGKQADEKTNVMRILDGKKIKYKSYCYLDSGVVSGMEVAHVLGQDANQVFKTLVTVGRSGANYVFVIPVCRELDLKKAAACVGEKKLDMRKSKELFGLTGYVHGGCSPIGMKKAFVTVVDESAARFETIIFSAGRTGYQVELALADLQKVVRLALADVVTDEAAE